MKGKGWHVRAGVVRSRVLHHPRRIHGDPSSSRRGEKQLDGFILSDALSVLGAEEDLAAAEIKLMQG